MPVGIGRAEVVDRGAGPVRAAAPRGYHAGALWLAAAAPILATLLLLARLIG